MTPAGAFPEEAARLLAAAEAWLRSAAGAAETATAGGVHELFGPGEGHVSDSPCQICPFCQLISAARRLRPEVVDHLTEAAASVLLAFRALTDASEDAPPDESRQAAAPRANVVQRITVN